MLEIGRWPKTVDDAPRDKAPDLIKTFLLNFRHSSVNILVPVDSFLIQVKCYHLLKVFLTKVL